MRAHNQKQQPITQSMKAITFASLIASAFMGTSAGAQNLILNGGFESPLIPNNSRQTMTPISWTVGSSAILINGNGGTAIFPLPQEGQQYASVATSPIFTLSQNFSVTLGEEYMLQWFDITAHGAGATSAPYSVLRLSPLSRRRNDGHVASAGQRADYFSRISLSTFFPRFSPPLISRSLPLRSMSHRAGTPSTPS